MGAGRVSEEPPPQFRPRQRVRYIGVHGTADGPTARVWRITKSGVWVVVEGGRRECWHPDDVRPAEPSQGMISGGNQ